MVGARVPCGRERRRIGERVFMDASLVTPAPFIGRETRDGIHCTHRLDAGAERRDLRTVRIQ